MKKYLLYILICDASFKANAQSHDPGGVKGASCWYITTTEAGSPGLKNNIPGTGNVALLKEGNSRTGSLNFYPSLLIPKEGYINIPFGNTDLSNMSCFTVYQTLKATEENTIWNMNNGQTAKLVLTNRRIADLQSLNYINFTDKKPFDPKVSTYLQKKSDSNFLSGLQYLHIGKKPVSPSLPVTSFSGLIPELVIYNRVLNNEEQIKVASYLALKYGVTLSEPGASYLNSSGEKIWDGAAYDGYHNNIAGIIRDDASGLFQLKATSSNMPGLLVIATHDSLQDNSSVLWGDNGGDLVLESKAAGLPQLLEKKWIIIKNGLTDSLNSETVLDTKQLDIALPSKPVFWMTIDRSGKGKFTSSFTEYYRMDEMDANGQAHFKNIKWSSGAKEAFGFLAGGELLAACSVTDAGCGLGNGSINVRIWGGKEPFRINLFKDDQQLMNNAASNGSRTVLFDGLITGRYKVKVQDKEGNIYEDIFYVNNENAPHSANISNEYILYAGEKLSLDASGNMPAGTAYLWKGPGHFISTASVVTITAAGNYILQTSNNDCVYTQQFMVKSPAKGAFTNVSVYPDPAHGIFTTAIQIDKPADVELTIYSSDGKLVSRKIMQGFSNYTVQHELTMPGLYFLHFRSGMSETVKKIIVTR